MALVADLIAAAVIAKLTVPAMTAVPAAAVFDDLVAALAANDLPAIAVEAGDESDPQPAAIGQVDRTVDVRVSVLVKGARSAAAAAVEESFGRLVADRTLGGLALFMEEGPTERDAEGSNELLYLVTKTYRYTYRTALNAL